MKRQWRNCLAAGLVLLLVFGIVGCGGSGHSTPEKVAKALIQAYADGKEKKVKECYGQTENTEEDLQSEITATMQYFQAHDIKKLEIEDCEALSENEDYTYVYITYALVLQDDQKYPCVGTYMIQKQDKKYYILPPSKITDDMRSQAAEAYAEFMTTDTYKDYTKAYDAFIAKNPGYEDSIAEKIG